MVRNIEVDMSRVHRVASKILNLVRKKSDNPVEGLYALKASVHVMRCSMKNEGVFLDNEAQLDADLISMIDEGLKDV